MSKGVMLAIAVIAIALGYHFSAFGAERHGHGCYGPRERAVAAELLARPQVRSYFETHRGLAAMVRGEVCFQEHLGGMVESDFMSDVEPGPVPALIDKLSDAAEVPYLRVWAAIADQLSAQRRPVPRPKRKPPVPPAKHAWQAGRCIGEADLRLATKLAKVPVVRKYFASVSAESLVRNPEAACQAIRAHLGLTVMRSAALEAAGKSQAAALVLTATKNAHRGFWPVWIAISVALKAEGMLKPSSPTPTRFGARFQKL